MKTIKIFCRECGCEMLYTQVRADRVRVWHPDGMGGSLFRLDSPFDDKTGEKNVALDYICQNSQRFFNHHDRVVLYQGEKHYL